MRLTEILARVAGLPLADVVEWLADYRKDRYPADRRSPCDTIPRT